MGVDLAAAVRHISLAVRLHEEGGFDAPRLDGYQAGMAFLHAMHDAVRAHVFRA